jgi:hypothetical protein
MLPVPVTELLRVTPPYVNALTRVSAPLLENVDVAIEPKEAVWLERDPPLTYNGLLISKR